MPRPRPGCGFRPSGEGPRNWALKASAEPAPRLLEQSSKEIQFVPFSGRFSSAQCSANGRRPWRLCSGDPSRALRSALMEGTQSPPSGPGMGRAPGNSHRKRPPGREQSCAWPSQREAPRALGSQEASPSLGFAGGTELIPQWSRAAWSGRGNRRTRLTLQAVAEKCIMVPSRPYGPYGPRAARALPPATPPAPRALPRPALTFGTRGRFIPHCGVTVARGHTARWQRKPAPS